MRSNTAPQQGYATCQAQHAPLGAVTAHHGNLPLKKATDNQFHMAHADEPLIQRVIRQPR